MIISANTARKKTNCALHQLVLEQIEEERKLAEARAEEEQYILNVVIPSTIKVLEAEIEKAAKAGRYLIFQNICVSSIVGSHIIPILEEAGYVVKVDEYMDDTVEMIISWEEEYIESGKLLPKTCTRKPYHDGPCNGFPSIHCIF